jgi:predicted transcriptional regulator
MNDYIKVQGHENLYRDPRTGAIVNTEKPTRNTIASRFSTITSDINNLKEDVSEIKSLLRQLIENGNYS